MGGSSCISSHIALSRLSNIGIRSVGKVNTLPAWQPNHLPKATSNRVEVITERPEERSIEWRSTEEGRLSADSEAPPVIYGLPQRE